MMGLLNKSRFSMHPQRPVIAREAAQSRIVAASTISGLRSFPRNDGNMLRRTAILFLMALTVTACGFHLRGDIKFAFHSLYLRAPAQTPLIAEIQRELALNKVEMQPSISKADVTLEIVSERSDKQIIALSSSGRVQQYLLSLTVLIRAYDAQQREWLPAGEIRLQRDFPYDDSQILAMAQEEELLRRDMYQDAAQQVLRRLSVAKPPPELPL
jgi:LPS-assembly lipoprotein